MALSLTAAAREAAGRDLGPGEALRIAFAGGCGALGFRLAATRFRDEQDQELVVEGIPLLLDPRAAAELSGAILDYHPDEGFVLDHPAWGASC